MNRHFLLKFFAKAGLRHLNNTIKSFAIRPLRYVPVRPVSSFCNPEVIAVFREGTIETPDPEIAVNAYDALHDVHRQQQEIVALAGDDATVPTVLKFDPYHWRRAR